MMFQSLMRVRILLFASPQQKNLRVYLSSTDSSSSIFIHHTLSFSRTAAVNTIQNQIEI